MSENISKAWYIKFPSDPYALGPFRFTDPVGEAEVRKQARKCSGYKRLPNGFQCWTTEE